MNLRSTAPLVVLAFGTVFAMTLLEGRPDDRAADMALRILFLSGVAAFGAALPFSFALQELRHPRDDSPLEVDAEYRKDDRYFATALQKIVFAGRIAPPAERNPIERINGDYRLTVTPAATLDVDGNVFVERGVEATKDIHATGDGVVDGAVRGLQTGGNVTVGSAAQVRGWVDSRGIMKLRARSNAGARATSLSSIEIDADAVVFRLLSAPVITVENVGPRRSPSSKPSGSDIAAETALRVRADGAAIADSDMTIADDVVISGDLIVHGDLRIGRRAVVTGSVHSDGRTWLEPEAVVKGSAYAEGDLHVGEGAEVHQHAISRSDLFLGPGSRVGKPDRVTTALADRHVRLHAGATIYGRVVAGEGGITVNEWSESYLQPDPAA